MKTKKLLLFAIVPLLMTSCGPKSDPGKNVSITDAQGRTVTYNDKKINRIICLGAGALRYYSYVCDMKNIIAVEEIDSATTFGVGEALRPYYIANYDTLKSKKVVTKGGPMAQTLDKINTENIIKANPDLIVSFLSGDINNKLEEMLETPVIGLKQGMDGVFSEEAINSLRVLGTVFNKTERAEELINYIDTCKDDFKDLTMTTEKYYFGGIGNWGTTSMLGTMIGFPVAKYAKVTPAITKAKNADGETITRGQGNTDIESLIAANPDKVFLDTAGINGFISDYKADDNASKYDSLKAFEDGETYFLMPYNAYYTNLEIQLMSTYYVASIAHPNEFEHFDIAKKLNEITSRFLGKEMYNEIKTHKYGLGGYGAFDVKEIIK